MEITAKEAAIVAIIVETILYGLLIFLFGVTVWALTHQRTSTKISRLMLGAACLLFLLGTMHIVVDANHFWHGFITSGDPDAFFQDVTKNTFKNALNLIETLVGDAIIIYRGYLLWQRIEFTIIPIIGWMGIMVTGSHSVWSISHLSPTNSSIIFLRQTPRWVISFYSIALATNLIATGLLIVKLWITQRDEAGLQRTSTNKSVVHPVLVIVMECGAVYSLSLITMLSAYLLASNSAYIVIDMIGQIIPITFYVIIVRAAMLRFERDGRPLSTSMAPRGHQISTPRSTRVRISRIATVDSDLHDPSESSHCVDVWDGCIPDIKSELPIITGTV